MDHVTKGAACGGVGRGRRSQMMHKVRNSLLKTRRRIEFAWISCSWNNSEFQYLQ